MQPFLFSLHLKEFKLRFGYLGISFCLTWVSLYTFSSSFFYLLTKPLVFLEKAPFRQFIYTDPGEAFYVSLKACSFLTPFFFLPVFCYSCGCFFSAGLYKAEHRKIWGCLFASLFCFFLGSFFALKVCLPLLCKFMAEFEQGSDLFQVHLEARISSYINATFHVFSLTQLIWSLPPLTLLFSSVVRLKQVAGPQKHFKQAGSNMTPFTPTLAHPARKVGWKHPHSLSSDQQGATLPNGKIPGKPNRPYRVSLHRNAFAVAVLSAAFLSPPDFFFQLLLTFGLVTLLEGLLFFSFLHACLYRKLSQGIGCSAKPTVWSDKDS